MRHQGVFLAIWAAMSCLTGCGGSSGGEETVVVAGAPPAGGEPQPAVLRVDQGTGDDSLGRDAVSRGAAWRTIQRALDLARPGDTIRVLAGADAYSGLTTGIGRDPPGIILRTSGRPGAPLRLEGLANAQGRRPVIDQGATADADGPLAAGLVLECVSHVEVRGFEIRNVREAGITTSLSGCVHASLVIEQNVIHQVRGSGYVAGIRLAHASGAMIRDNAISHVVRTGPPVPDPLLRSGMVAGSGNTVTRNSFEDMAVAVHLHHRGTAPLTGQVITANTIQGVSTGLLLSGSGDHGPIDQTSFSDNLLRNIRLPGEDGQAVAVQLGSARLQSTGLVVARNTLAGVDQPFVVTGMHNVTLMDNVIAGVRREVLTLVSPPSPGIGNSIARMNHNLYVSGEPLAWAVGRGSPAELNFSSLASWRTALSVSGAWELLVDPDGQAGIGAAPFRDEAGGDFRLRPDSIGATLGSTGGEVGAFAGDSIPGPVGP